MKKRRAGFVQRRFVWPLLFAPLWGTLFVSFGIGPIVTRVDVRFSTFVAKYLCLVSKTEDLNTPQ